MRRALPIAALTLAAACQSGEPPSVPTSSADPPAALGEAPPTHPFRPEELVVIARLTGLGPAPPEPTNAVADDPDAAHLGQFLFFDERLSGDGSISCATCHEPGRSWTDGERVATGVAPLTRHTQSLWNVGHNRWFFWDGRADTLWSQALIPLENEREHDASRLQLAHLVHDDPDLCSAYELIFGPLPDLTDPGRFPARGRPVPDEPEHPLHVAWTSMDPADQRTIDRIFTNLGKCLAAYQRHLLSDEAVFDWYAGAILSGAPAPPKLFRPEAVRGLQLFVGRAGCANCHHGPNFTDMEFHDTRVPDGPGGLADDPGRQRGVELLLASDFNGVGPYSDDPTGDSNLHLDYLARTGHEYGQFKTPSLRNAVATPPYMHAGQFATLEEVLHHYSTLEGARQPRHIDPLLQPLNLSDQEIADLIAFLSTLADQSLPYELMVQPESPSRR